MRTRALRCFALLVGAIALTACSPGSSVLGMANPDYWTNKDLAGPDVNHNGIRDDVDAWIARQSYSPDQRRAVEQFAKGTQAFVETKFTNREAARQAAIRESRAQSCIFDSFGLDKGGDVFRATHSRVSNTRERILNEDKNDAMLSGMAFESNLGKMNCD